MWNLIGSTVWARQTLESDIFYKKPDKWFKIWFFLINRVNYKDNKQFKRGECFTTYAEISDYTKATRNQIDRFMRWAKWTTMLTTQKTTRGMIVFIVKYAKFQDAIKIKSDTKSDTEAIQKRYRSDTIKKNDKNNKNNSLQTASAEDFNSDKYIKQLIQDKQPHISLIGIYFKNRGCQFPDKKSAQVELRRWVKDASIICKYSQEYQDKAYVYVKSNFPDKWQLSTITKYINQEIIWK